MRYTSSSRRPPGFVRQSPMPHRSAHPVAYNRARAKIVRRTHDRRNRFSFNFVLNHTRCSTSHTSYQRECESAERRIHRRRPFAPSGKEHHRVEELEANAARQQKQIEALTAGLTKVSTELELSKTSSRTVVNSQQKTTGALNYWKIIADKISRKPVGASARSQPWILTGEQSGVLTGIARTLETINSS